MDSLGNRHRILGLGPVSRLTRWTVQGIMIESVTMEGLMMEEVIVTLAE